MARPRASSPIGSTGKRKMLANGTIILGVGIVPLAYVAIPLLAFHSDYTASEDMASASTGTSSSANFVSGRDAADYRRADHRPGLSRPLNRLDKNPLLGRLPS